MSRYQLRMELLSDLCVSDGGVYNSALDTDICYDSYGFPFIPGKRIKGCLRECALELADLGMAIPIGELFGEKGVKRNASKVRIGDAHLENYENMAAEAKRYKGSILFHPQNVLSHFSYVRTQTAIDYETGVADATSLRTMRVANKGLVFLAEIELTDDGLYDCLKACCDTFTNMGIGRTRGLGEIRTDLEKIVEPDAGESDERTEQNAGTSDDRTAQNAGGKDGETPKAHEPQEILGKFAWCEEHEKHEKHAPYQKGATWLDYELSLEEPVICKSTNGGESRSMDYIEGSKLLGLVVQQLNQAGKDPVNFLNDGELFCSNAYISEGGERCLEIPANYYQIKNEDGIFVEKIRQDQLPEELREKQLNRMGHCYIRKCADAGEANATLTRIAVGMEERYHHRRPEDKSIGRAADDGSGDSRFYQMSSIEAGQSFRGYVTGTAEQIRTVYECLERLNVVYLGYSRSSEYGKVRIRIIGMSLPKASRKVVTREFSVKLEAPALIYNDRAFYSTNVADLDAEIRGILGLGDQKASIDRFVNTAMIGGYNVTWNARKPMAEAFDKGTVLHYCLEQPAAVTVPEPFLIGERISEGFGEASVQFLEEMEPSYRVGRWKSSGSETGISTVCAGKGTFAEMLCEDLFRYYVRMMAVQDVKNLPKTSPLKKTSARPTVSNMLLMCKESSALSDVESRVQSRFGEKTLHGEKTRSEKKEAKLAIADKILDMARENSASLPEQFGEKYSVSGCSFDMDVYELLYLEALLGQLKYEFRQQNPSDKTNPAEGKEEA